MGDGNSTDSDAARAVALAETTPRDSGTQSQPGSPPTSSPTTAFEPGARIGRYEVVSLIGAGGMGVVVRALDPELGRDVAIKLVRPRGATQESRERLLREARVLAQLRHPNIVPVYDVGTLGEEVFVVMQFVSGSTLGRWLQEAKRPWIEVSRYFAAAASGLSAAHRLGLVHRDFKPENVLLGDDGTVMVADFGLARATGDDAPTAPSSPELVDITRTGQILGTPAYMAPEQLEGGHVDERADQFAFCVALWEALFGVRPFDRDGAGSPHELVDRIREGPSSPRAAARAPSRVRAALARGLARDPRDRWPSVDDLVRNALGRRRPVWMWPAAILAFIAVVAAIWLFWPPTPRGSEIALPAFVNGSSHQLTFDGNVTNPALSYDGNYLAYVMGAELESVIVHELSTGKRREVFSGATTLTIRWSRSGELLLGTTSGHIRLARDGVVRNQRYSGCVFASWSPDDTSIAAHCMPVDAPWMIYDVATGAERITKAALAGAEAFYGVDWGTNGLLVLTIQKVGFGLWVLDPITLRARQIHTDDRSLIAQHPRWDASGTRLYYSRLRDDVFEVAVLEYSTTETAKEVGVVERVSPVGANFAGGGSYEVSSDAEAILSVRGTTRYEVMQVSLDGKRRALTTDTRMKTAMGVSPDHRAVAFAAGAWSRMEIVVASIDGAQTRTINSTFGAVSDLVWSPDGSTLLVVGERNGIGGAWGLSVATGEATPVPINDLALGTTVDWGARGIFYTRSGTNGIGMFDPTKGTSETVASDGSMPVVSPDGTSVAFFWMRESGSGVYVSTSAGAVTLIYGGEMMPIGWSADGEWVYLTKTSLNGNTTLLAASVKSPGRSRVALSIPQPIRNALVLDDESFVVVGVTETSDIWMTSSPRRAMSRIAMPQAVERPSDERSPLTAPINLAMDGELDRAPTGWTVAIGGRATIVRHDPESDARCVLLRSTGEGSIKQWFDPAPYRGRRIHIRFDAKSEQRARIAFELVAQGETRPNILVAAQIDNRMWETHDVYADVHPEADRVALRFSINGGSLWVDNISIELVD